MGLREAKKARTRELIADAAWRLFADRGFDQVTVAEVAGEAEVAEATIRNYFASKEDLFYWRFEAFGERLVAAIAARDAGEPVVAAFRRELGAAGGLLAQAAAGDHAALDRLRTINRVIAASPALRAREQRVLATTADALAAVLAGEAGDFEARVVANALMGVHRALIEVVRERVVADDHPERLAADVRTLLDRGCALLERGLDGYAGRG